MIEKPPPSPPGVTGKLDLVELRIGNLRRELGAETDASIRAAILYHIGSLFEHDLGRLADAKTCYEQAQEAAPSFQPAAVARMRIAERGGPPEETLSICSRQIASTSDSTGRAVALLDLGLRSDDWPSFLREAMARASEPVVPALLFEWLDAGRNHSDALREALRTQAEHASDLDLRGALFVDLALTEIGAGEIDAALASLDLAAESEQVAWAARSLQRRTAREHERWPALVRATAAMADLLESAPPADPLSCSVPNEERLPTAALLWNEAATVAATRLEDAEAASTYLDSAIRLLPEDHALRLRALLLAERRGDPKAIAASAAWFRESAPDDPAFVAHEVRQALEDTDPESSLGVLREAVARYPGSAYANAALDVGLIRAECRAERIERLRSRAESAQGDAKALAMWHAARLANDGTPDSAEGQVAFVEAAQVASRWSGEILRDALGAAVEARDGRAILARCDDLLERDLPSDERCLLVLSKYVVLRYVLGDRDGSRQLLRAALDDPDQRRWAPQVARARAARAGDRELLALAHEVLAAQTEADTSVAHLCAAGRAHARAEDWKEAERVLRDALALAPEDRCVIDLLEGVLREGGRPEDVVELARERASAATDSALGEHSLLLAGATAERKGNLIAAQNAYREALRQSPDSASAALALGDASRRAGDARAQLRAYEHLSDGSLGGGVPELFSLLRGDALGFANGGSVLASAAYERALGHPATVSAAAVALLATPKHATTDDQRSIAEELLGDAVPGQAVTDDGFPSAYSALTAAFEEQGVSADDAWLRLAALAPNDGLRAEALLHGMREARVGRGQQGADELFMLAHESAPLAADWPKATISLDEALEPGDDPEARTQALGYKLDHGAEVGRGALDAAHCRALVEADQGERAVGRLTELLDERPDDLAVWENLRVAARQAGQWALVAQACERLAVFVDGTLKADLLEEAGAVRLDCLGQDQQAEDLFRAALEADPSRHVAFRRLRDLLAEREDAEALEELVNERLALGGPKDRPDLLYERARLLRGFSDRPGALEVLDELFETQPDHSGALALAAEVHVSLEQWAEAVDCLRRLSRSAVPDEQRRVAHLGAADFLETRLGDQQGALKELRAVETLGLADESVLGRIAALEEKVGRPQAAAEVYRRVLEQAPTDAKAVERLSALTDGEEREAILRNYEIAVWSRIDDGELDASMLEALRRTAHWRGDLERSAAVASVEGALDPNAETGGPTDLAHLSLAVLWDGAEDTVVDDVVRRAGAALVDSRPRGTKLTAGAPAFEELARLTERFGGRLGSVTASGRQSAIIGSLGRDDALHWVLPEHVANGLDPALRFRAGRLAWAAARGATTLLDDSVDKAAGTVAGILRAARCRVSGGPTALPAVAVKLRRTIRKSVHEVVGDTELDSAVLRTTVRRIHRRADRAGLLACGDIGTAFTVLLGDVPSIDSIRVSERCLDLLRFWVAPDSPLWRNDA